MTAVDEKLEDLFYSLFPRKYFDLRFGANVDVRTNTGRDRIINVQSLPNLFYVTHEMAHIVETPNVRLFEQNFGLKFPTYNMVGSDISTTQYKTDVPFKRELRVYGIQYAIAHYAKNKFGLEFPRSANTKDFLVAAAKHNLLGSEEYPAPYMSPSLQKLRYSDLCKIINKKIFEYGEEYHYLKLRQRLDRKFEYIRLHR